MRKVGIDLGTTNLLICVDNEGIVIDEPSILTIDAQTKKCIAAGKEAKEMLGRTPRSMICISPQAPAHDLAFGSKQLSW